MPQAGWYFQGRNWTNEELKAYAADHLDEVPYDPAIIDNMWNGRERNFYSPTMMTGCPRQEVLKRLEDYYLEPEKAYKAWRGTLAHTMLENLKHEADAVLEKRFKALLPLGDGSGVWMFGKPDKIVPSKTRLIDYKTLEEVKSTPKDGWTPQLSSYRWLLGKNGIEINEAVIQQISMGKAKRLPVEMWDLDYTEEWLRGRMSMFKGTLDGWFSLDNLPPMLDFILDPNAWLCRKQKDGKAWCPVQAQCFAHARAGR